MMEYDQDPKMFSIPKRLGVRRRVMKLGDETIKETKDLFAVCPFFISLPFIFRTSTFYSFWREKLASP